MSPKFAGTVQDLIDQTKGWDAWSSDVFKKYVMEPLSIEPILKEKVQGLTGSELQRLSLLLCLAKPCQVFLIDYPSQYLDIDLRITVANVIQSWVTHTNTFCLVSEHDYSMAMRLCATVILFQKSSAHQASCTPPLDQLTGMQRTLQSLGLAPGKDFSHFFPKMSKFDLVNDRNCGNYKEAMVSKLEKLARQEKMKPGAESKPGTKNDTKQQATKSQAGKIEKKQTKK